MIRDLFIARKPSEDGTYRIIKQVSKRLQYEKGCSRFYYMSVIKGNLIGYTFSITEKQLYQYYEKLTHQNKDKGEVV